MASLFVRDTRSLVRDLGRRGELVPADSLLSCPRLRPFCLLRRKPRHVPWLWDRPLVPTDFSLMDMLEPGAPTPEVSQSPPIHIWETMARAVSGAMSASAGLQGKVTGSGAVTHSSALAVQTLRVAPHTWEELVEKRKLRTPRPPFLRELQRRKERKSLYVVMEAVETLQDTTLQSLCKVEGAGQLSFLGPGHFMGRGQAHMTKEKTVTVPQGSVLAYRVLQLVIEEDHWAVLYLPEEMCCRVASGGGEPDFGALQRQAGPQLQGLTTLPLELQTTLHGALQELLRDPRALQALEDTLEEALDTGLPGQLEGPGGVILSTLWDPAGSPAPSGGRAFLYVLGALVVLSDAQQCLLAQALERRVLLELVASILEPNLNQMAEMTFSLLPEVLSSLQSEDVALALSLLESCGLELQGPGCQLTWDPDMGPQLAALYGSLAGLQLLADPSLGAR